MNDSIEEYEGSKCLENAHPVHCILIKASSPSNDVRMPFVLALQSCNRNVLEEALQLCTSLDLAPKQTPRYA